MTPFYAQVFGIGLLWVTVHCIGMCGPIMVSLTTAMGVSRAPTATGRIRRAVAGVLAYQSGRALVYMGLGAAAGAVGAVAEVWIQDVARIGGLVIAAVIVAAALFKLVPGLTLPDRFSGDGAGRWTGWMLGLGRRFRPKSPFLSMALFGLILGFLPCVLMFWILGIAASTASVFHGAMIMLLLVAMTTPVLALAACGSSLPGFMRHLRSERVIGFAMLLSGLWLGLIAFAANGWIGHAHIPLEILGRELVIMLW